MRCVIVFIRRSKRHWRGTVTPATSVAPGSLADSQEPSEIRGLHSAFLARPSWGAMNASAARYVSASAVRVGLPEAVWGKAEAAITQRFATFQCWRLVFTTLFSGDAPITAPPWICVV